MSELKGLDAKIKIAANVIQGLNDASFSLNGETIDVTTFNMTYKKRIQGLKEFSMSLSGFYTPSDANGQKAIESAAINGTEVNIAYLPDGTNGFSGNYLATFEIGASPSGEVTVSYSLESTGELTIV